MSRRERGSCATCYYFFRLNDDVGMCQRNPPVALTIPTPSIHGGPGNVSVSAYQPVIDHKTWCGEHRVPMSAVSEKLNS